MKPITLKCRFCGDYAPYEVVVDDDPWFDVQEEPDDDGLAEGVCPMCNFEATEDIL